MRICLCIAEDDLRAWVMEELLLMTTPTTLVTTPDLTAIDPSTMDVLVVGIDRLAPRDLDLLRARTWEVPVIAIGGDAGLAGTQVLPSKLTSRELKQAIRAAVHPPPRSPESAVV